MARKMLEYIKEQPVVWREILQNRDGLFREFVKEAADRDIRRILIVGSGSSFIAANLAAGFYEKLLGIETRVVVPTRADQMLRLLEPKTTLAVAVSQSGKSTSTIHVVESLKARGFYVVSVTANSESPVAGYGDLHQLIACGEESVGPKTKGMTGTVLTLYLMGLLLGRKKGLVSEEEESRFCKEMENSIEAAPENIKRAEAFCRRHCETWAKRPHFLMISEDAGYDTAQEGALKVLETLYVPAMAYEAEEYMHGINNTIEPGICNLFLPVGEEQLNRMKNLERYTRDHGSLNYVVTTEQWEPGDQVLLLSGSTAPEMSPFTTLLAMQIMSVYGSEAKGIECDIPKFHDFYEVMDTKA